MTEEQIEAVRENAQSTLNAAGFSDIKVVVGWFNSKDGPRPEVKLEGDQIRAAQARKLLPFKDSLV